MDLTQIKGIGETRKKAFEENGIFSCEDLINYFPYKYYDFTKTEPFSDDGKARLIKATIIENPKLIRARGNLSFVSVRACDEIGHNFSAVWFNQTFIKSQLYLGETLFLYGKNSPKKKNTFNVSLMKKEDKLTSFRLLPVYHSVSGVGQATISDTIDKILQTLEIPDIIPSELLLKYNIMSLSETYKNIHSPVNYDSLKKATFDMETQNLLPIIASNNQNNVLNKTTRLFTYENITLLRSVFISLLPFKPTLDQEKAIDDLIADMSCKLTMNRLLQGDVGSGKTIVALFGAYVSAKNGFQSAIIAPTEILAKQHFETARKIFSNQNIEIALLSSSTSVLEREIILQKLKSGEIKLIIGTHSILSEEVCFHNLSYTVFDEQHRFGVSQRAKIKEKSPSADILVMSATPIPRSLALVIYGNLDFSVILSRPKQCNITTNIVIKSKQNDMWTYIKNKLNSGSKAYVVCGKIDEENDSDDEIKLSAKNMHNYLCSIFDSNIVGLIHGKLKKETQDRVIENFRLGKIKILVSTTIVEVGVDVPDSDIMVIASPERFGLATLHQLRGRIGRNGEEAHCFCLADNLNDKSYERVKFFKEHLNGFEIAEFDLKTRGGGTMYGTNQHGTDSGIVNNFTVESYNIALSIYNEIKNDTTIMQKLVKTYFEKNSRQNSKNIIMN